jgi:hypothetical protein
MAECCCFVWTPESLDKDTKVRFCEEHHRYWRDSIELVSVTRMLRWTWPIKPNADEPVDQRVIDNARDRGVIVDRMFSAYVIGKLDPENLPPVREDAIDLFNKLRRWWDAQGFTEKNTRSQLLLADGTLAGQCDLFNRDQRPTILDVKCVYDIDLTYQLQVGGYGDLASKMEAYGEIERLVLLHATKRFKEVRVIEVDAKLAMEDWRSLRRMYEVVGRRTGLWGGTEKEMKGGLRCG